MSIEIKIPQVGESISEVQISEWLKAEGDPVQKDEPLAVIDSEKTTFELPSAAAGRLGKILHPAGDTVSVGAVVAHLEPAAPAASPATPPAEARQPGKTKPPAPAGRRAKSSAAQPVAPIEGQPAASAASAATAVPTASRPAASATGVSSNRQDADAAEAEANGMPEPPIPSAPSGAGAAPVSGREEEVVPMTMLRRTIARRLVEAQQTMAMLTTFNEVEMSAVQSLRQRHQDEFQKRHGVKLGWMSFFVKAAIDALKQFPQLNARLRGNDIVFQNYFDLGVAIATERGLVVPVLQRAERLSFAGIEKTIGDFAQRARQGTLLPEHLEGGTFTITNGGVFGSILSTPLINPPQAGILGLHAIEDRPVARQGQVVIRPMMYVALTYDHRLVDGREAVLFLRRIKESVEEPARLLMEV